MSYTNNLRAGALAFAAATAAAPAALAQDISSFGQGLQAQCPDVVVVDIPFCTDECGQFLWAARADAVAEAFDKADVNNDGTTYAYITGSASRLSPALHNQALSQGRVDLASRLARAEGAQVVFTAALGETRARGTESADYPADRMARIYFTEATNNMVQSSEGVISPRAGLNVIGFSAPACNGHLRTGPRN